MYAHRVIEDIKRSYIRAKNIKGRAADRYKLIMNLNGSIHRSEKFDLSPVCDMYQTLCKSNMVGHSMFAGEIGDVRTPYDVCLFSFQRKQPSVPMCDRSTKCCMLTVSSEAPEFNDIPLPSKYDPFFHVWIYDWLDRYKLWVPEPQGYKITPTTNICAVNGSTVAPMTIFREDEYDCNLAMKEDAHDLSVLNMGLLLLSCKNIGTVKHQPDFKLNKARKKRGKLPLYSFHTLVIKPTGKQEQSIPKDLWHNRIHMCRGHFKTYTKEKPLMGKHTGRYWWQPLMRGKDTDGVVEKDYVVTNGAETNEPAAAADEGCRRAD